MQKTKNILCWTAFYLLCFTIFGATVYLTYIIGVIDFQMTPRESAIMTAVVIPIVTVITVIGMIEISNPRRGG